MLNKDLWNNIILTMKTNYSHDFPLPTDNEGKVLLDTDSLILELRKQYRYRAKVQYNSFTKETYLYVINFVPFL